MTEIDELIARMEAASEGSRELDARLQAWRYGEKFLKLDDGPREEVNKLDDLSVCWVAADNGRRYTCWRNLAFTRSIDAAATLVPEGMDWTARTRREHPYRGKYPAEAVVWGVKQSGFAATPALALCIAALRASEQQAMTAATEIVEAVARAICAAYGDDYGEQPPDLATLIEMRRREGTVVRSHDPGLPTQEDWRECARAAIAAHEAALAAAGYVIAPREPTEAMVEAGGNCGGFEWDGDTGTIWPAPIWRAMIAALGE